jgi:hypothetical protein
LFRLCDCNWDPLAALLLHDHAGFSRVLSTYR